MYKKYTFTVFHCCWQVFQSSYEDGEHLNQLLVVYFIVVILCGTGVCTYWGWSTGEVIRYHPEEGGSRIFLTVKT